MKKEDGYVEITHHLSKYMYRPLVVKNLLIHKGNGTLCSQVTQTNEEALIIMGLLRKHGVNSKLIQSTDGFYFWDMAEIRFFLKYIENRIKTPLISDELWEEAKHKAFTTYERSTCLTYLKRCLSQFAETNKAKYLTDLKEFIFESSIEDFCDISDADVVVSTIHKAKGREFDDVYMLVSNKYPDNDELRRRYYVGMTRAKNRRSYIQTVLILTI